MSYPFWIWTVRFKTSDTTGESMVIATHPAAAKRSVAAGLADIETFERPRAEARVPPAVANQHFDGYAPRLRRVVDSITTVRSTVALRGD